MAPQPPTPGTRVADGYCLITRLQNEDYSASALFDSNVIVDNSPPTAQRQVDPPDGTPVNLWYTLDGVDRQVVTMKFLDTVHVSGDVALNSKYYTFKKKKYLVLPPKKNSPIKFLAGTTVDQLTFQYPVSKFTSRTYFKK